MERHQTVVEYYCSANRLLKAGLEHCRKCSTGLLKRRLQHKGDIIILGYSYKAEAL